MSLTHLSVNKLIFAMGVVNTEDIDRARCTDITCLSTNNIWMIHFKGANYAMFNGLGHVRQLGFVVRDLDESIDHWVTHVGVGPFFRADDLEPGSFVHRGKSCAPRVSVAVANSGPMQIELIVPRCTTPTMWSEFLDSGRQGLQHVAYWTDDFARAHEAALAKGWRVAETGIISGGRLTYFEAPTPHGLAIELSEQSPDKDALFTAVRHAAESWDGTDPIRSFTDLAAATAAR